MNKSTVELPFTDVIIGQLEQGHPVTEASAFLQEVIAKNTPDTCQVGLELGSGNGIISFMLALQKPEWKLTGIEIMQELKEIAERNNEMLNLRCSFVKGDIRDFRSLLKYKEYDLVFSNPPWCLPENGRVSPDPLKAAAKHELSCRMRDIMVCIDWCLNNEGIAWTIYPVSRKPDLEESMVGTCLEVADLIQAEAYPKYFIAKLTRKPTPCQ